MALAERSCETRGTIWLNEVDAQRLAFCHHRDTFIHSTILRFTRFSDKADVVVIDDSTDSAASTAYSQSQASTYDESRFTSKAGKYIHRAESRIVLDALRRLEPAARVLEVGCGTGRLMIEALAAGHHVDGADASPHMLKQLESRTRHRYPGINLVVAQATTVPKPDATYDMVYSVRLLNQTESPAYALDIISEMARLTKPGGYILVEFVNVYRPRWGIAKRPSTRLRPSEVVARGRADGAEVVAYRGAFVLSMQAYHLAPKWMTAMVYWVDRLASALLPRLCSRCYVLMRKRP